MIRTILLSDGGKKVYSTDNYKLKQKETGAVYDSPVFDSPKSRFTYEETKIKSAEIIDETKV